MHYHKSKYIYVLVFALVLVLCCETKREHSGSTPTTSDDRKEITKIFEKVDDSLSGIEFMNSLTENLGTLENLFNFDYFYNGAGVGLEDINNDGLLDIFFCGNQVDNRLYLNKGNLQFEDITETAGINANKIWSNGVTFADINNDGWMDIYVSQGGPNPRLRRKNLLYINQKNNTFSEQAEAYGLADFGISTQSTFFDMDNDGDLDCVVMNENEYYGVDPVRFSKLLKANPEAPYFNSSHLYRNDNGKFVDITKASGIQRPIFGLGLAVSDINEDGWLDIYIASDYYLPDALFINNKNGTFSDKIKAYTKQISYYGMGIDIADINNDSRQDIFVLDMASSDHKRSKTLMRSMNTSRFNYLVNEANYHYQYMYNSLQLNTGNNKFNNVAQMTNTANTDWSWSVLMSDFDLDEDKDIYITNGYRRYALDNDLQNKVFSAQRQYGQNMPIEIKKQLYYDMPSEKLPNILYENKGGMQFENSASSWGLSDFTFSNGAAQGDLDNDGDLDLVVNNIDETAMLYRNTVSDKTGKNYLKIALSGQNSEPFAKVQIKYAGKEQFLESRRVRGYRSSHDQKLSFGLGKHQVVDTVRVRWLNGLEEERYNVSVNTTLKFDIKNAKPSGGKKSKKPTLFKATKNLALDYRHKENTYDDFDTEILLPYKQSSLGPFISKGDINNDGLEDLYVGGASGMAGALFQAKKNGFQRLHSEVFEKDKDFEDQEALFFDFDGDGDMDLYVVSGGNQYDEYSSFYADRLYINEGGGRFSKSEMSALSQYAKNGKTVTALDFDKDGDTDILVGNRVIPKNYPKHQASQLFENQNGQLVEVTKQKAPELDQFGIINKLISSDFNNDGWPDIVAVGEWTGIGFFENKKGKSFELLKNEALQEEKGWWFDVKETDANKDGLKDYLIGNVGLNLKFSASKEKPFKIFASDFDDNGSNDIVLSKQYQGEYVPVRGRECSSEQMPFIKEKFGTYTEFANASLDDIYGQKLKDSYRKEVTEFRSILLLNKGDGKYEKVILPPKAQEFPILAIEITDLNKDGFDDCILAGNIYETEVETPRLDAFTGLVLLSDKQGGYVPLDPEETGLYLEGNVKDLSLIENNGKTYLLATVNNGVILTAKME